MKGIHNLKPEMVVKAFERAGWTARGQRGSHVQLTKAGNRNILSIPVHKGKSIKQGLLLETSINTDSYCPHTLKPGDAIGSYDTHLHGPPADNTL